MTNTIHQDKQLNDINNNHMNDKDSEYTGLQPDDSTNGNSQLMETANVLILLPAYISGSNQEHHNGWSYSQPVK